MLQKIVRPWVKHNYGQGANYVLQQDGAPCHTSKKTLKWLVENKLKFWPPNSPDLNPLDYSIWAYVAQKACRRPHPNVDSLTSAIRMAWRSMTIHDN